MDAAGPRLQLRSKARAQGLRWSGDKRAVTGAIARGAGRWCAVLCCTVLHCVTLHSALLLEATSCMHLQPSQNRAPALKRALTCTACIPAAGVELRGGEVVPAALVIDASGRFSQLPAWLAEAGWSRPDVKEVDAQLC